MNKRRRQAIAITVCIAATISSCRPIGNGRSSRPLESWANYHAASRCIRNEFAELFQLTEHSTSVSIFVGHAYGTSKTDDGELGRELKEFISSTEGTNTNLIFLGDVFEKVSAEKVENLGSQLVTSNVFLSPGNHDEYGVSESWWTNASFLPPARYDLDDLILYVIDTTNARLTETIMTSRSAEEIRPSIIAGHHVLYGYAVNHDLQGNVSAYGSAQVVYGTEEYFSRFEAAPTVIFSGDASEKRPIQCTRDGNQVSVATALYGSPVDSVVVLNFQRGAAYLCFLSESLKTCTDRHI